jgi:hypothetical protein
VTVKTFTYDPQLPRVERHELAAALATAALMAGSANPGHIAVSFLRTFAARVEDGDGPVTMKLGLLDTDGALIVRRVLYSAAERAKSGGGLGLAETVGRVLAAWETCIRYDAQPTYSGPRNPWGEPVITHKPLTRAAL